ncbi:plasmid replication protein RepC [Antarctobacter sp.]|uniref:plasmid replication protein RepC n=1 Tax=Antarctobacter sp. TaxID=1872577 RepID=UPI002B2680C7|nr:plasmid replication protein RepC [Antarctobacter sp.]
MMEMSRIPFGQPVELCPSHDKWALLDMLTRAAARFGLNHRTLTVLRALLSFFPERELPASAGLAVVFPSNRTLSQRLNGMPESTLRRHLATLVRLGIVSRQDSANRKRFARSGGLAFGFDLSPLAREADTVAMAAEAEMQAAKEIAALRAQLAATRMRLIEDGTLTEDHPLIEETRLTLRRKTGADDLRALLATLENHLDNSRKIALAPAEMSAETRENERHIQTTDESISVSRAEANRGDQTAPVSLTDVVDACHEYRSFLPDAPNDWDGLQRAAGQLYPMMGIDRPTYEEAHGLIGRQGTAVVILCILEKMADIRSPGAYLRGLCKRAVQGRLNLKAMVKALNSRRLSADNLVC